MQPPRKHRFGPRRWMACIVAVGVLTASLAFTFGGQPKPFPTPAEGQVYFGIQFDPLHDTIEDSAKRLGATPAVYGRYVEFPISDGELDLLNQEAKELAARHASLMLTLEPMHGLDAVTDSVLASLTKNLANWNRQGLPVIVRFAHEMNGSWYPWGQRPAAYVATFRRVAAAVHRAPSSAMLWSPNEGGGYPFAGGPNEAKPGSADFTALDTNYDGKLSMADDPYAPYWPGDDAVDWVGLTAYHFGAAYPWGENEVPDAAKLAAKITGTYKSAAVDETAVPDFYATYAEGHAKPFALAETGALYNSSRTDGASEQAIKQAWWNQLFDPSFASRFPRLKMALWFELAKKENDTGQDIIDWRATADPALAAQFRAVIPDRFRMAPLR